MGRRFAEIAFTSLVKQQQQRHGSRAAYERVEQSADAGDRLTISEQTFIEQRDGFYMASVTEAGWPYVQYRGGPKGFLHVIDEQTIGFADLRGDKQYISLGNLLHDDRLALFLMDYTTQSRLKILGHATIYEGTPEAAQWIAKLRNSQEKAPAERAIVIRIEAFDWNCQQYITARYSEEELAAILAPMRRRMEALEAENAALRNSPRR